MSQSGNDAHLGENTLLYNGAGRVFLARVGRTPEEPAIVRFDLIMPIDSVTVGAVSRTIRMLTQLYRGFNIHLRIAYEDVVDELKSAHDGLAGRRRPDDTGLMRLVNRALNFSVAVRLYEEHVMSEVHRRWGKARHRRTRLDSSSHRHSTAVSDIEFSMLCAIRWFTVQSRSLGVPGWLN